VQEEQNRTKERDKQRGGRRRGEASRDVKAHRRGLGVRNIGTSGLVLRTER